MKSQSGFVALLFVAFLLVATLGFHVWATVDKCETDPSHFICKWIGFIKT